MKNSRPVYLDCNATTPLEPAVLSVINEYLSSEYGNAGSRTHDMGNRAKLAVQKARTHIATLAGSEVDEVVFTSGATESNNLSILGLADYGREKNRKHIISTQVEHKAVLEPLEQLSKQDFEVTLLPVSEEGTVDPDAVSNALTPETLLVSIMHVNNETGVVQPVEEVASVLEGHDSFFHVDAAQSFGKLIPPLQNPRIDLISASAHKIYGPKGVGALIMRRRDYELPPLKPLVFGGGQERGVRPGTLPVPLVAGFGEAAKLAKANCDKRSKKCRENQEAALKAFEILRYEINGNVNDVIPHTLNISINGVDSEATMLCLKGLVEISNGSACTSASYTPSHVLAAMGYDEERIESAIRISWSHLTDEIPWEEIAKRISMIQK